MRKPQLAPDWGRVIDDMLKAGHSQADIGKAMNVDLTDRMLSHYRAGVQPTYWRGAALLALWVKLTKRKLDSVYMVEVVRGHRVPNNRGESSGPRVQALPQWPAPERPVPAKRAKKVKEPA